MRYNQEPLDLWCEHTFGLVDEEGDQVVRWTVEGRSMSYEPYRSIAIVSRNMVDSAKALHTALLKEGANAGVTQIRVKAWMRGAKNQSGTCTWRLEGHDADEDDEATAAPTGGIVGQALHHNRFLFKMATQSSAHTIRHLLTELDKAHAEIRSLRDERIRVFELTQDLQDRKQDRELKAMTSVSVNKAIDAAVGLAQFKLMGLPPSGEQVENVLRQTLSDFFASLTPQQIEGLQATDLLRPEQKMTLLGLFSGLQQPDDNDDDDEGGDDGFQH